MPTTIAPAGDTPQRRDTASRDLLAALVDASRDAIIGKTLDGVVTSWNPGAEHIYGYTAAEMIGQPISRLVPPDRPDEIPSIMVRLRRGERVEPYETERVRKDGRRVHISLGVWPLRDTAGEVTGAAAIARDITERVWTEALAAGERRVLELGAQGTPLEEVLETLVRTIEEVAGDGLIASVMLLRDGVYLHVGAGAGLPEPYRRSIEGLSIGPAAGSCGTAAFRRETVIVADIATDPLWEEYRHLALPHGLGACWSTPIVDAAGGVLGTFAFYYATPREPSQAHVRLAASVARTAAVVIERARAEALRARLEDERERLLAAEQRARLETERASRLLAVQHELGRTLAGASLEEAPARLLQMVCEGLQWVCGAFWEVDEIGGVLRCAAVWPESPESPESPKAPDALAPFSEASVRATFEPGAGLPGRVWTTGEALWIADLSQDDGFARAPAAARAGLRSGWAFPVRLGGTVAGVVESFAREVRPPEEDVLATASALGALIGQSIARRHAEMALRESEARFRELFDLAPVGYQELDAQGRFVRVNQALCDLLGYAPEELIGRAIWEFQWAHGESSEETRRKFFQKLERAEPWRGVERVRVRKDGGLRTVWVEDRIVRDAAGGVVGLRSAQLDVTERMRAEQERDRLLEAERAARAEAEGAVRARDQFVATLSHDLQSPLTTINGYAQLLGRQAARGAPVPPDPIQTATTAISATVRKMVAMVGELLDATKLDAGQPLVLRRRLTDLVALATDVVQAHQQGTSRHEIRLETGEATLTGEWDDARLERVLTNLVGNAIKYAPAGGPIVVALGQERGDAVISVSDRGMGIPAADLPHVFERYRRGSNVADKIAGTGLGLAGARDIMTQHGGSITAHSVEGEGTTFTVRLPLTPPVPTSAGADSHPRRGAA